jgi:flavin reductase (DIM6/NTAB) family NADH-FMN oxidoreductase RutF/pimeloyl-ACP methyl ester carboxylesterase
MRYVREFKGFAGIRLEADDIGSADDPSIVLLHGPGQTRADWENIAIALEQAGRHVINLDLRGHGGSEWPVDGRYDFSACVEDLRAVLAQMRTRPVLVGAMASGWIATAALAEDAATLAAALVLVDLPATFDVTTPLPATTSDMDDRFFEKFDSSQIGEQLEQAAAKIQLPVLLIMRALSSNAPAQVSFFAQCLPDLDAVEVDDASLRAVTDRTEAFNALLLDFLERKQPRAASEFRVGSDARTLRDALGCFATGVTIITAITPDGMPVGLTANSFTSVSLDPPLLLVCVANNAGSAVHLRGASHFAVNVLQIGQQPTSNRFAGKTEDRFEMTPWTIGETGAPVLTGSLSTFECSQHAVHDGGDHFILVGHVERASFEPRRDPLLYFRGKYRRLHFA